ncbi:hypothetical protein AAIH46_13245 [Rhizobium sp. 0TCS1.26]|uniref:hypothetical protein n=1 Tax=Rhizobium sp. 0TCS1.26 TaxID=3142623 RepID=UPI003D2D87DF
MDIRLTGWRSKNIRGGLRDIDIDLGSDPARWTLVQMPNGTGKTTTMDLLRWTLASEGLPSSVVRSLRADDDVETGLFEVRLLINGRPLRLQLELDFRDGSATYWTVREQERGGGREEGRALPNDLRDLLKPALTELFVFNGELATQILDLKKDKAASAVRALYRLDTLDAVESVIRRLVEQEQRRAASITTAKEKRGITQLQTAYDEIRTVYARLEQQESVTSARLAALEQERQRLRAEFERRISQDAEIRGQLEIIDASRIEVDAIANDFSGRAMEILRRPTQLHQRLFDRLSLLGGKLYELKLPETISREFFNELAERNLCICGRPIGHEEKHTILRDADRFLAQDQIAVINQMKLALRASTDTPEALSDTIAELQKQLSERQRLLAERDRLTASKDGEDDEILQSLQQKIRECEDEIGPLSTLLERLTTKDPARRVLLKLSWENNLALCDGEVKQRKLKLETATKTRTFGLQGERLAAIIDETADAALDILRERVRLSTNDKLHKILKNEKIVVAKIGGGLELRSETLGSKRGASEGQKLSIAYAFLTSLLAEAPYKLPFIVDSPAVSLDTEVRREVGDLIPDFFGQMVMFVISSERAGFADAFYARPGDVHYLTVVPQGGGTVRIAEGIDAFKAFHGREN